MPATIFEIKHFLIVIKVIDLDGKYTERCQQLKEKIIVINVSVYQVTKNKRNTS